MAGHNELGKHAEQMAEEWLKANGYEILYRNWRHKYYEIDIIAMKNKMLHIVEVKARHSTQFGYPEDSVTKKKFKSLQRAADEFLHLNPRYTMIQYDILSIILSKNKKPEFFLIEDVYM